MISDLYLMLRLSKTFILNSHLLRLGILETPRLKAVGAPHYCFASNKGSKKKDQKDEDTKEKKTIRESLVNP